MKGSIAIRPTAAGLRRLVLALALLGAAACGNGGLAQVGPTLPDVTEDGRLSVAGRVMNVLDVPIEHAQVTLTVLHVSGATYVESAELLREGEAPLAPFESVPFRLESSVAIDEVEDFVLAFETR